MNQRSALLLAAKRELKAQGITYKQLAEHLKLSENSIKRLFSEQNTSLDRLEQICDLLGLSLSELVKKMEAAANRVAQLTEEQEKMIISNHKLLLVSICVLHYWRYEEIIQHYQISDTECTQLLVQLDKLNIIELLPLNKIRVIVAKNFRWRENGPVQNYFRKEVQQDFFTSNFQKPGEKLLFATGMLSRGSHQQIEKRMNKLINEFNEHHNEDSELTLDERFGSSLVVAMRAWEFSAFTNLRRNTNDKSF